MAQLFQWMVPCTLCESPVEYHCNTCGDVLCPRCRDMHLRSNATRYHIVVPYTERVELSKESGQCEQHPGHDCGVWCQNCKKAVCGECLISPNHKGHDFLKIEAKIEERRKEMQKEFERHSSILEKWKQSLQDVKAAKDTYEESIEQLDKEIGERADKICKDVRETERKIRQQLYEMKDFSLSVLQEQTQSLTDGMQRIKQRIKELEEKLRENNKSYFLQYTMLETLNTRAPKVHPPHLPVFNPGSRGAEALAVIFGNLSQQDDSLEKTYQSERVVYLVPKPFKTFIIEVTVEKNSYYTPTVACLNASQAWVKSDVKQLKLVNKDNTVQSTVNIGFITLDMVSAPQQETLLLDRDSKLVKSLSTEGVIKDLFQTQRQPISICRLPSGDVMIIEKCQGEQRVVQYSITGRVITTLSKSLFGHPRYVAYNNISQHLYVCDKTSPEESAPGRLLALDMAGQLQYAYIGPDTEEFIPTGVCTNQAGHVLVADYERGRVHILDKDGNFLQYMVVNGGLRRPMAIDVDSKGYAWIGEYHTGKVKVVKYLDNTKQ